MRAKEEKRVEEILMEEINKNWWMMMGWSRKRGNGKRQVGIKQERSVRVEERVPVKTMLRWQGGGNDGHMGELRRKWKQVKKEGRKTRGVKSMRVNCSLISDRKKRTDRRIEKEERSEKKPMEKKSQNTRWENERKNCMMTGLKNDDWKDDRWGI